MKIYKFQNLGDKITKDLDSVKPNENIMDVQEEEKRSSDEAVEG